MKKQHIIFIVILIIVVVSRGMVSKRNDMSFDTPHSACISLRLLGLHCNADNNLGDITNGFMLSRTNTRYEDVAFINRGIVTPGVVWVSSAKSLPDALPSTEGYRVYGGVYLVGDPVLLDEIEAKLR